MPPTRPRSFAVHTEPGARHLSAWRSIGALSLAGLAAFALALGACGASGQKSDDSMEDGGTSSRAGEGLPDGSGRDEASELPDAATEEDDGSVHASAPLLGCETFLSCCTSPGVAGYGTQDDECGSRGVPCEDCRAEGKRCRTKGQGLYACVTVLPDGAKCEGDWECLGAKCDEGVCKTPCVPDHAMCEGAIGRSTCCTATAQCTPRAERPTHLRCCLPKGTVVATLNECGLCCAGNGLCDSLPGGSWQCR